MNNDYYNFEPEPIDERGDFGGQNQGFGLFDSLRDLWQWDSLAAEIGQESQARVAFVGLTGVGKSLLFNRLRGWIISGKEEPVVCDTFELEADFKLESLGVFVLVDLPPQPPAIQMMGHDLTAMLSDPALIIYLLDSTARVTVTDYRWIAAIRASGKPLLAALNKCDLVENLTAVTSEVSEKLGMPVIPISALEGTNVEEQLLPGMLDMVPRLAVPLGRELRGLRRVAARRVIRQAALLAGVVGVQPIPLLDLPFQVMIQVGVVMRVGATYGYVPTGSLNREVIGVVVSTLGIRYLALGLVKLVPFVGWAAAGVLSSSMTFLIGEAAIHYYEAGATIPLKSLITNPRERLLHGRGWFKQKLRRRPRWVTAVKGKRDEEEVIEVADVENGAVENRNEKEGRRESKISGADR